MMMWFVKKHIYLCFIMIQAFIMEGESDRERERESSPTLPV